MIIYILYSLLVINYYGVLSLLFTSLQVVVCTCNLQIITAGNYYYIILILIRPKTQQERLSSCPELAGLAGLPVARV